MRHVRAPLGAVRDVGIMGGVRGLETRRRERPHEEFLILDEDPRAGMTIEVGAGLGGTDCDVWDAITAL